MRFTIRQPAMLSVAFGLGSAASEAKGVPIQVVGIVVYTVLLAGLTFCLSRQWLWVLPCVTFLTPIVGGVVALVLFEV